MKDDHGHVHGQKDTHGPMHGEGDHGPLHGHKNTHGLMISTVPCTGKILAVPCLGRDDAHGSVHGKEGRSRSLAW